VDELRYLMEQDVYIQEDDLPAEDYMAEGIPQEFEAAYNIYLDKQRKYLSMDNIKFLESGHVALLQGNREKADIQVYLDLCNFVLKCKSLSGNEADEMITLVKRISHMNGKEIPLPQRFRTLYRNVIRELNDYKV